METTTVLGSTVTPVTLDHAETTRVAVNDDTDITDSGNDAPIDNDAGDNMANLKTTGSRVPAGTLETFANPIMAINTIDVPRWQLKQFVGLPDFFTKSDLPIPIAVMRDDTYWVIGGFDIVEKVNDPNETVRVLEYILADNSDLSLAFEKMGHMDRPLGGVASAAEIIWLTAHLPSLIAQDENIKLITGHGGSRKGPSYNEGALLTKLIAKRLKKPESVAKNYVFYGKYVHLDILRQLAERRLERRFFESISARKTGLLKSLTDKTEAEKADQVSLNILEWLRLYDVDEAARTAKLVAAIEAVKAARALNKLQAKVQSTPGSDQAIVTSSDPIDQKPSGDEPNGDETFFETSKTAGDDTVITRPPEEGKSGSILNFLPDTPATAANIFAEIAELAKTLANISQKKPPVHELRQELRIVIGDLNRIMTDLAEDQDLSTATTLSDAA